jgi:hypothetical protein
MRQNHLAKLIADENLGKFGRIVAKKIAEQSNDLVGFLQHA